jgi:3-dehydroquinate synthase
VSPTTVTVELADRSYTIEIGAGLLARAGSLVRGWQGATHVALVTDENVADTHAASVAESLAAAQMAVDLLVVEPGEETKSIDSAEQLWLKLLDVGTQRTSIIVAVGGGVVGDLAGFVAATFARGLAFVQVPTTLLAQVDSSVGGKVGVNLPGAKNMVGAFWQPLGVIADTDVLATLPTREYRAGLAEVVKYGVILDAEFFAYLESHLEQINSRDPKVLAHLIARSCQLRASVVALDERETTGARAALNYGHTFCHAFEAVSGYGQVLHGEAVAMGMLCASRLAERLGRISADVTERQRTLLAALGLPVDPPALDADRLLAAMQSDKKASHGRLRFVLPSKLGHVDLVGDVDANDVRAVLRR